VEAQRVDHVFEKLERIAIFRFEVFGQEFIISNSIFVSWIIMAILIVASLLLTRRLSVDRPKKPQVVVEWFVGTVRNLCRGNIGHHGGGFAPYLGTLLLFLGLSNIITLFNFIPGLHLYPPTKDINTTGALALMSIVIVLYASFRYKGVGGWLKSLAEPTPIMIPFKLMEYATKPLSLCLRLFGNVLACFIIMELILGVMPPAGGVLSIYFDIFDGILQAFIFTFLTTLYIGEAVE